MECYDIPIMRKITSQRNLSPCQRRRLKRLAEIFRKEGRIPPESSFQEMRYLLRLETARRGYRRKRCLQFYNRIALEAAQKRADPSCDQPIEEILAPMARKKDEQQEEAEE